VRHLTDLDRLREGIGLRALAQQDPLVAYKREAFEMYSETDRRHPQRHSAGGFLGAIAAPAGASPGRAALAPTPSPIAKNIRTNRGDGGSDAKPQTMRKTGQELGRNDLCWCGSGKKYKNCHMKSDQAQGATPQRVAARR
jgi:preprotein translocase subunit SecA